jgi:hypothetical protein
VKRVGQISCLALIFSLSSLAATITPTSDATTLVNAILGPGITLVGTPTLIGVTNQQGTFTGATAAVGFDSGIVLTSGSVLNIFGQNTDGPETRGVGGLSADLSEDLGRPGDADLNTLAGFETHDANALTFNFRFGDGTSGGNLFFNFVFASEEYIDWIDTDFNDVFGFYVDGINVALVAGQPITVNTINDVANSGSYINNVTNTNGLPVAGRDTRYDGLTRVLLAQKLGLGSGEHTMSFRVADASDGVLDAAVFIQGGTFSEQQPTDGIPEPASMILLASGIAGLVVYSRLLRRI